MPLPNPGMDFTPFDPLPAASLDDLVENIEALADGSGLDTSSVDPENLLAGTGSSWVYASYSPTLTNLTIGTGTVSTNFIQIGKMVKYEGRITIGNNAPSGVLTISLPVTARTKYGREPLGIGSVFDADTTTYYPLYAMWQSNTTFRLVTITTITGANPVFNEIGTTREVGTSPITFATGDIIAWKLDYEAA